MPAGNLAQIASALFAAVAILIALIAWRTNVRILRTSYLKACAAVLEWPTGTDNPLVVEPWTRRGVRREGLRRFRDFSRFATRRYYRRSGAARIWLKGIRTYRPRSARSSEWAQPRGEPTLPSPVSGS